MKTAPFLAIVVCLSVLVGYRACGQNTNKFLAPFPGASLPPITLFRFNWTNMPVDEVLKFYKTETKCDLIIASDVRPHHSITVHAADVSTDVMLQKVEQALLKQAGVVITRVDVKRVSVTYNDQLELENTNAVLKPTLPAI